MTTLGVTVQGLHDLMDQCGGPNAFHGQTMQSVATYLRQLLPPGMSLVEYMQILSNDSGVVKPAQYAVWHAESDLFLDVVHALEVRFGRDVAVWSCLLGDPPASRLDQAVAVWQSWLKPCCATCIEATKTKRMLRRESKTLRLDVAMTLDDETRFLVDLAKPGIYLLERVAIDDSVELGDLPATQKDLNKAVVAMAHDRVGSSGARAVWHYVLGIHSLQLGQWTNAATYFQQALGGVPEIFQRKFTWQVLVLTAAVQVALSTEPIGVDATVFDTALANGPGDVLVLGVAFVVAKLLVRHGHHSVGFRVGLLALKLQKTIYGNDHELTAPLLQWVVDRLVLHSQLDQVAKWLKVATLPKDETNAIAKATSDCGTHAVDTMTFIRDFEVVFSAAPASSDALWHENNGTCDSCGQRIRGTRKANFKDPLDTKWVCGFCAEKNPTAGRTVFIRPPARYYRECLLRKAAKPDKSQSDDDKRYKAEFATYQRYCSQHRIPAQERVAERGILGVKLAFFTHYTDSHGRAAFEGLSIDQVYDRFMVPSTQSTGLSLVDQFSQGESTRHLVGVANVFVSYDPTDNFLEIVDALRDYCGRHALSRDTAFWFRSFSSKSTSQPSMESLWKEVQAAIQSSDTFLSVWTSWQQPSAVCNVRCVVETRLAAKAQVAMQLCVSDAQTVAFHELIAKSPYFQQNAMDPLRFQVIPDAISLDMARRQMDGAEVAWLKKWSELSWTASDGVAQKSAKGMALAWIDSLRHDSDQAETQLEHLYAVACLSGLDESTLPQLLALVHQVPPTCPLGWRSHFYAAHQLAKANDSTWESTFLQGLELAKTQLGATAAEVLEAEHALGVLCINKGDKKAGLATLVKCYRLKEATMGRCHVSTLRTAEVLGRLKVKTLGLEGIDTLSTILSDYEQVLPDDHNILQSLRAKVAFLWAARGRYDRAKPLVLEAYHTQVKLTPAMDNAATLQCLANLVGVALRQGDFEEAQRYLDDWCNHTGHHAEMQHFWGLLYWGTNQLDRAKAVFDRFLETNANSDAAEGVLFSYFEMLLRSGELTKANVVWELENSFKLHTRFNEKWPHRCQCCLDQIVGDRVMCTACPVLATSYCVQCFETNKSAHHCRRGAADWKRMAPPPRFLQERRLENLAAAFKYGEYDAVFTDYERYCSTNGLPQPPRLLIQPSHLETQSSQVQEAIKVDPSAQLSMGLTLGYFKKFIDLHGGREAVSALTTRQVSKEFLLPFTEESKLSLVEHVLHHDPDGDKYVKKASIFVSHSWDYLFLDVVDALDHYLHANDDTAVWFCTFCNNQHLVSSDNPPPFEFWVSQFKGALAAIGNVVMVFDRWNKPGTLERSWCVFEVWAAVTCGATFDVALSRSQTVVFIKDMDDTSKFQDVMKGFHCENSTTSVDQDRVNIFAVVEREIGFPALNKSVLGVVQKWIVGTTQRRIDNTTGHEQAQWRLRNGIMCYFIGDYDASLKSLQLAPSSKVRSSANYLCMMASAKVKMHRPRHEWEPDMLLSIKIRGAQEGGDSDMIAAMRQELGRYYDDVRAYDQAVVQYEKAWAIRKKTLHPSHPYALYVKMCLGIACCKIQDLNRGLPLLLECQDEMKSVLTKGNYMMCLGAAVGFMMDGGQGYADQAEDMGWPYQLWLASQEESAGSRPDAVSHDRWIEWLVSNDRSLVGNFAEANDQVAAEQIVWTVAKLHRSQGRPDKAMTLCYELIGAARSEFNRKECEFMGVLHADQHQYDVAQEWLEQALACGNTPSDDVVLMLLFHVMVKNDQLNTLDKIDAFETLCIDHDYDPNEGWNGMKCSTCREEIVGNRIVCSDCPIDAASFCSSCSPSKGPEGALACGHMRQSLAALKAPGTYLRQQRLHLLQVAGAAEEYAKVEQEYQDYCETFGISCDHRVP